MRLLAPAKINVHLRVGPRRGDGFHPLLSWMSTVGLFDTLVLEAVPARGAAPNGRGAPEEGRAGSDAAGAALRGDAPADAPVSLACDLPGLPCDERNLVVKIACAWMEVARSKSGALEKSAGPGAPSSSRARASAGPGSEGQSPRRHVGSLRATLSKRIPVGAGLGGGSSDAARTLLGLNRLWQTNCSATDLASFAARFGSDLAFFFFGPSSVCRGRGELVVPIAPPSAKWAVLVLPGLSISTADVYRRFDEMGLGDERALSDEPDWPAWAVMKSEDLLPRLVNDLERPAFGIAPQLDELRRRVERSVARPVRMSGSGSSLFTLFDAASPAQDAATAIERETGQRAVAVEVSPIFTDDLTKP